MDSAHFLSAIDVFSSLGEEASQQLAERAVERSFAAGTTIIKRGDPGDCMFVIVEGRVRIPILDPEGKQRLLVQLESGQVFGEMALITGEPRTADVVAETDCRCLILPKDTVDQLMHQHPQVARVLTAILGKRLSSGRGIQQVGKYRLIGELGRGGMAVVFEGVHPTLGRSVAVKMLSHELVYHEHFAERFRNEARIIAALRHPNIVEVFDTEESYATFFIVMEKLRGMDLERVLHTRGSMPFDEVRRILRQSASALHYAHSRGVVHRDVKPSNIVLGPDGTAKLTDFGLALVPEMESDLKVDARASIGTPFYMAPEQITKRGMDARIDVYALGIVAYELLTGTRPFDGHPFEVLHHHLRSPMPSPRTHCPDLPADLEELVAKATAKSPNDRFQSCREMAEFLEGGDLPAIDPERVSVRTVTLVFDSRAEEQVEEFVEDVVARASKIPGVLVS